MRFFFNVKDGLRLEDPVGIELPSLAAGRIEAVRFLGHLLTDDPHLVFPGQDFHIEVTDDTGAVLFTIVTDFQEAPRPDPGAVGD